MTDSTKAGAPNPMTNDLNRLAGELAARQSKRNGPGMDHDGPSIMDLYQEANTDLSLAIAALDQAAAQRKEWRKALSGLLKEHDKNTCTHEETYRGGAVWTVCAICDAKWSDDDGGFKPHEDSPAVTLARALLSPSPETQELEMAGNRTGLR